VRGSHVVEVPSQFNFGLFKGPGCGSHSHCRCEEGRTTSLYFGGEDGEWEVGLFAETAGLIYLAAGMRRAAFAETSPAGELGGHCLAAAQSQATNRPQSLARNRLRGDVGRPGLEPGTNALKGRCSTD
jgi:hypothetical protein